MSSNSCLVALLLGAVLAAPSCAAPRPDARKAASPDRATCAATHDGVALSRVSVFDGPPEEQADLVPDGETTERGATVSRWNVASVYRAGRIVHAVCRYDEKAPVAVALTMPVRTCRLTDKDGVRTLSCR